jgi:hypothetical protein
MTKQQQFSQNLRNLADWYDQHPEAPTSEDMTISVFFEPTLLPTLPAGVDGFKNGNFNRVVPVDGFSLKFYTYASGVAIETEVEKTTTVKEWVVKPELLASVEEFASV